MVVVFLQVALNYLMCNGAVVIPGAKNTVQVCPAYLLLVALNYLMCTAMNHVIFVLSILSRWLEICRAGPFSAHRADGCCSRTNQLQCVEGLASLHAHTYMLGCEDSPDAQSVCGGISHSITCA